MTDRAIQTFSMRGLRLLISGDSYKIKAPYVFKQVLLFKVRRLLPPSLIVGSPLQSPGVPLIRNRPSKL